MVENPIDNQNLERAVSRDKQALELLGYTSKEVGSLVIPIINRSRKVGMKSDYSGAFIYQADQSNKTYLVLVSVFMGILNCPYNDEAWYSNNSLEINLRLINHEEKSNFKSLIKLKGEKSLIANHRELSQNKSKYTIIPGFLGHSINVHGYFGEGENRVAPEKIVEMFGVERIPGSLERVRGLTI